MKTVHLDWSDNEGVSFLLRTAGLWPFEAEEISAVFVAAGYADVGNAHQHFVSAEQPRPDGLQEIADALEAVGYRAEHHGDLAGDTVTLMTASSVLYAYSDGKITEAQAIELLHLDDRKELLEAVKGSEVPLPREPFAPSPEQIVRDAIANSRLSGYEVPEESCHVIER